MEDSNDRIIQLQQTGIELWHRAETWRTALEQIKNLTDDRMVLRHIERTLKGNQS